MLLRSTIFLTAATALVGAASEVHRRDFAIIQGALNNVNALLQQIDTSIVGLTSANIATSGAQLLQLGQTILPSLQSVVSQIQASAPLTLDETNGLNAARTALGQNVNLTVSDLIRQKPLFDMAGLSGQVADEVQQVRDASGQLFTVVSSKLAPGAPDLSAQFTESLNVFDMAIAVFRGQAVAAAPGAPGAPAGPATPPVTGMGTLNGDGSCNCAVTCPAGSFV